MCCSMLRHDEAKYAKLSYLLACSILVTESGNMILIVSVEFLWSYISNEQKGMRFHFNTENIGSCLQ